MTLEWLWWRRLRAAVSQPLYKASLLLGMARETVRQITPELGRRRRNTLPRRLSPAARGTETRQSKHRDFEGDEGCPRPPVKTERLNTHIIAGTLCATVFVCSGITDVISGLVTFVIQSYFLVSIQIPAEYVFRGRRLDI